MHAGEVFHYGQCCSRAIRAGLPVLLLVLSLQTAAYPLAAVAKPTAGPDLARRGSQPFVTILCKFADVGGEPEDRAFFERLLSEEYPGLGHYWRAVSYDTLNLAGSVVTGWHTLPAVYGAYFPASGAAPDLDRLAQDCANAAGDSLGRARYAGINFVFNAGTARPAGGQTCLLLGGARECYPATWIWPMYYHNQALWAHEMGHAFGLRHSATGGDDEYDSPWDVMSAAGPCGPDPSHGPDYGPVAQEPIAYDKDLLGWIPPSRKVVVPAGSLVTVTLERLAEPGPGGALLVEIPIDGSPAGFYTVEARRQVGYDAHLPYDAVVIHEVDAGRDLPARPVDAPGEAHGAVGMWTPGSAFHDTIHHIAVSVERETQTGFIVAVDTRPREAGAAESPSDALSSPVEGAGHAQGSGFEVTQAMAVEPQPWSALRSLAARPLSAAPSTTGLLIEAPAGHADARVTADGAGGAYAIWRTQPDATPGSAGALPAGTIIFAAHRPAGADWGPAEQVSGGPRANRSDPVFAVGGGRVYAAWIDDRSGVSAVYFAERAAGPDVAAGSDVAGRWGPNVRINDNAGPAIHAGLALAADGQGNVHAAWSDNRDGRAAIYTAYRPVGGKWSRNTRAGAGDGLAAALAVDGAGRAYLGWIELRGCSRWSYAESFLATRQAGPESAWGPGEPMAVPEETRPTLGE